MGERDGDEIMSVIVAAQCPECHKLVPFDSPVYLRDGCTLEVKFECGDVRYHYDEVDRPIIVTNPHDVKGFESFFDESIINTLIGLKIFVSHVQIDRLVEKIIES